MRLILLIHSFLIVNIPLYTNHLFCEDGLDWVLNRESNMDDNKRLELIRLSATDFEAFKKQFEILSPAERMEFKNYIERVQGYINDNENKKMEDVTGFPAPQSS